MRRAVCIAGILAAAAGGAGCRWIGNSQPTGPRQPSIDEPAGSYKGVALGDHRGAALRVQPVDTEGPGYPIGISYSDGGPVSQKNPPGYDRRPDLLRYDAVSFLSTPTPAGIHSIVISDPRAATQKGVAIGDPLSAARRAYPGVRCHKARDTLESPSPA